ncbi:MAG TPA: hypothetical protein VJL84_03070 [Kiloniellales bacterium]|nr:hypothetical protein [Kiloniellales bacterium]
MSQNFRRAFWAVASLIKILMAEWIAVVTLAQVWGVFAQGFGRGPCPGDWSALDLFTLLGFLIGAAALAWWLWRTLWPTTLDEEFRGNVKLGPLVIQHGRFGSAQYRFLSTHPSYLIVDAVTVFAAWFLRSFSDLDLESDGCRYVMDLARGEAIFLLALVFPVVRLAGWYLLGRRVEAPLGAGLYPAIWFGIVMALPAAILLWTWFQVFVIPQEEAPLVDRLPAETPGEVVRIVGHLRPDSLVSCPCPAGYDQACRRISVVVELSDGVALVAAEGLGRRDLEALYKDAAEPFETYGRIVPKDPSICGVAEARPDLVVMYELP